MYHYLFTNDLRISNLQDTLVKTGNAFVTDTVPSAQENKSENNNMMTLGFYFNLAKNTNCATECANGNVRNVVLNFIKKFQFPNPRTSESLDDCVNDGITVAPMRIIVQVLYLMNMLYPGAAHLSREEILDFIFYNDGIAKTRTPNIPKLIEEIIEFRKNGVLPQSIEKNSANRIWKHEERQIREMTKVLTWSGCVSENEDQQLYIYHDKLTTGNKAALFDIMNCNEFWQPTKGLSYAQYRDEYQKYMDVSALTDNKEEGKDNSSVPKAKTADNIILYGVPGCGKSHKIKTEYCDDENFMERVVFHPDYTYSDFVGQILPKNDNGHISYPFIPGPFTRILKKAETDTNKDNNYYLIIEELNRGNAPAIFGEVFQLLDRIDGVSEYGINNADIALEVYGDANQQVRLPKNLYILATMNTADQNVFTLDTAFKRRWKMRSITNDINGCFFGGHPICNSTISWKSFLKTINDKIIELGEGSIGSEDKRLGAYFVQPGELSDIDAFAEKVLMYLWNDAFKYEHEKIFKPQYKTLEQLISGFKNTLFGIFNDNVVFSADCIDTVYDPSDDDSTSTGSSTAIWVPCSDFVKSWIENKKQQTNSIISSVLVKRGVTYKRFTTQLFDRLIPVSTSNTSGWNTTNHYFYEIVLKTNKLYVQFVCNVNSDTPQNILDAFENNVFPVTGRKLSEGLQWYCNRICDALPLTPDIEEEKVTEYLEKCYEKVVEFEKAFSTGATI